MSGPDIAYLQNALKHEKGQEGPAEICKFSGKKRFKGGAWNADTEIGKVYKENRQKKKCMISVLLPLCGNKKEPEKNSRYECRQ